MEETKVQAPTEVRVVHEWADADRLLLALRRAEAELVTVGADYDQRIQELQEAKAKALAPIQARIERMDEVLETFGVARREDFSGKKSLKMVHGVVGFRSGSDKVVLDRPEAEVIELLTMRGHRDCMEIKTTLVKAALKKLPHTERLVCGIRIEADERFYRKLASDPPITYPGAPGEPGAAAGEGRAS